MRVLKFSKCPIPPHMGESWEKLQRPRVGVIFTTYRAYEWRKDAYYRGLEGQVLEIQEEGRRLGQARLVAVQPWLPWVISSHDIRNDTFADATRQFWEDLLRRFYRIPDPVLLKLILKWEAVEP